MKIRFNLLAPRAVVLTTVATVATLLGATACDLGPRDDEILEVEEERGPDGRIVLELDVHDAAANDSYEVNAPTNSPCGVGDVYSASTCGTVK
jgi:hypothetical protein